MEYSIFIIFIVWVLIFIPNGGNESLYTEIMLYINRTKIQKQAEELKGDIPTILKMVNDEIDQINSIGTRFKKEENISTINPYETFIFNAECLTCVNPQSESITGCMSCPFFDSINFRYKPSKNRAKRKQKNL